MGQAKRKQNKRARNCLATLKSHPKLPPTIAPLQQMAQDQSLSFLPDQCVFSAHTQGSLSNGNTHSLRYSTMNSVISLRVAHSILLSLNPIAQNVSHGSKEV